MFAPDIQFVPGVGDNPANLYLYIPDHDKNDVWHIGVARAHTGGGSYFYDAFQAENALPTDYFQIPDVPGDAVITCPGDPGVLPDDIPNERSGGNHRQVCCKEVELVDHPGYDDDGTIVGVSIPPLSDAKKKNLFTTLDGQTRSIPK